MSKTYRAMLEVTDIPGQRMAMTLSGENEWEAIDSIDLLMPVKLISIKQI